MSKKVQFKKGIELKNKSVIEVTKGWLSCYRMPTEELNENGKPKYKYFDKLFVSEFNLIEEGTNENQKPKYKQETQADFTFDSSQDILPF